MNREILLPMCAMVGLTFLVWFRLVFLRVRKTLPLKDPQVLLSDAQAQTIFKDSNHNSDNFENLFEVPVLFYAAILTIFATGTSDRTFLGCAWIFVAFRAVHSLIHITYNRVTHRFAAYALSTIAVWVMWIRIAAHLT
jgi:hypothetical protein